MLFVFRLSAVGLSAALTPACSRLATDTAPFPPRPDARLPVRTLSGIRVVGSAYPRLRTTLTVDCVACRTKTCGPRAYLRHSSSV